VSESDNTPWLVPLAGTVLEQLPVCCHVDGRRLVRKSELHLTVMNSEIRAQLNRHPLVTDMVACVRVFTDRMRGQIERRLSDEAWILVDGEDLTVVVHADVPEMVVLYDDLCRLGLALKPPVPHVTLFMAGTARGIGLKDRDELLHHRVGVSSLEAILGAEVSW
jgi:hypothetical protein